MKTFVERLTLVQRNLKAPKGQTNSFGKYKYRSCEDILESVKPLLTEQNLLLTITDEIVEHGNRIYVKATASITDGEHAVSTTALAREEDVKKGMDSSQVTGAASSYARKYALNGLLCIDDSKDSDATNTHGKSYSNPVTTTVSSDRADDKVLKQAVSYIMGSPEPQKAYQMTTEKYEFSPEQDDALRAAVNDSVVKRVNEKKK